MNVWNLALLKYFFDAGVHGSVAESARINSVSQSAVSQAIRKLESQLGVALVRHQKRQFELSAEGREALQHIEPVLNGLRLLENRTMESARTATGSLRIATSQTLAVHFLPKSLADLRRRAPGVVPSIRLGASEAIEELVREGISEVGLLVDKSEGRSAVEGDLIHRGRFVVIGPAALAKGRGGSRRCVECLPFIVTETRHEIETFGRSFRKKFRRDMKIESIVHSWGVIRALVGKGLSLGLVPDFVMEDDECGATVLDLGLEMPVYEIKAIYKRREYLSKGAQLWLENLPKLSRS